MVGTEVHIVTATVVFVHARTAFIHTDKGRWKRRKKQKEEEGNRHGCTTDTRRSFLEEAETGAGRRTT